MSRKHRSLTSVLARSSTTEGLKLRSEVVQELTFYIRQAMSKEHADFLVTIDKARGFPALFSTKAQYPRTVRIDEVPYRPAKELVRRVLLWGRYGRHVDEDEPSPGADEAKIVPMKDCELLADCTIYWHSPGFQWELAELKLFYSDEGWHEPVARVFLNRTWIDEKGRYRSETERVLPGTDGPTA